MKTCSAKLLAFAVCIALGIGSRAQAPAGVPAGATGICKDGTYSNAASKAGACRGHKGVQTWYSAAAVTTKGSPAAAAVPSAAPAPTRGDANAATHIAPAPPPQTPAAATRGSVAPSAQTQPPAPATPGISAERAKLASMQPAAGGGPGLVWLNGSSKVYHCPGSEFYGKTKTGSYMSESNAKAKGAHADHNKPCS